MAGLSKSRILTGSQCHRRLWWRVHEPDSIELTPSPSQQAIFENGHRVGAAAVEAVPGGVMIEDNTNRTQMVVDTREALESDAHLIYEASFVHEQVFVAIDMLQKNEEGWTLIEVKSTASVKSHHHLDAAVQTWVAEANGIDITRVELMHLNSKHGALEDEPLFERSDITKFVRKKMPKIGELASSLRDMLDGENPVVPVGSHCKQPYTCEFIERCNPKKGLDHIDRLYRVKKPIVEKLRNAGIERISEIPDDVALPQIAQRQRLALQNQSVAVDPNLLNAINSIKFPAVFIDFEAINSPLPAWDGCRPYEQIPVQVSMHLVQQDGTFTHHPWLAEGPEDPRPALARAVLDIVDQGTTLVAYFANFEQRMFRMLAAFLPPEEGARLIRKCDHFVDLLPLVRNHVYHPEFGGRFSLKKVLPALIPELAYDDLEIQSGNIASKQLESYILNQEPPNGAARNSLRDHLLAYCERDTIALVRLTKVLKELGGST
jgi:predicted RecB family nuclease